MLKKLLVPALAFVLAACGHTVVPQVQPVNTQTATVAAPTAKPALAESNTQTYSGKDWSVTVPKTMVRQDSDEANTFDALDKQHLTTMYLQIQAVPFDLDHAVAQFAMHLASRNIDVQKIESVSWAGQDESAMIVSTKEINAGLIHFYSWATVVDGRLFHFGCIALPGANVNLAEQTCKTAANTVKFKFPSISEGASSPAPMIRTTN